MDEAGPALLELQVVMPVYNEESSVEKVIREWCAGLDACAISYQLVAIDDGSTDGTAKVLGTLERSLGSRLKVVRQENAGHGAAILRGYQSAVQSGVAWIFQIDSDGQCDPVYFPQLWKERRDYDIIAGYRTRREDGYSRTLVSLVLRLFLLVLFRTYCRDANVPYRLMRAAAIAPLLEKIRPNCFFTNVALSVLARRFRLKQKFIPITFRDRHAGSSTISYAQLVGHAAELYRNLKNLPDA
jgi:dolichol-phosphate mannosyltransferase